MRYPSLPKSSRLALPLVAALTAALAVAAPVHAEPLPSGAHVDLASQPSATISVPSAGYQGKLNAGDVNGDGRSDVIVGSLRAGYNARANSGSAYVIFGGSEMADVNPDNIGERGFRIDGAEVGELAGISVAGAGDVNGDGLADVLIGACRTNPFGRTWGGSAYVVFGKRSAEPVDLANLGKGGFRIDTELGWDKLGTAVAAAGDMNKDGLGDVIVAGSRANRKGRDGSGIAYVVFGKRSGTAVDTAYLASRYQGFRIYGAYSWDGLGGQKGGPLASAGDLNGDGRSDLILGVRYSNRPGQIDVGSVYVIFGKGTVTPVDLREVGSAGYRIVGARQEDHAGYAVAPMGDLNGDGVPDLALGAPHADNGGRVNSGSVYVVYGQRSTNTIDLADLGQHGYRIDGGATGDALGSSLAATGDLNADGLQDLTLGAPYADQNGRVNSGSAYVVYGKRSSTNADLAALGEGGFSVDGAIAGGSLGLSVGGGGDFNGDSRPDVTAATYSKAYVLMSYD